MAAQEIKVPDIGDFDAVEVIEVLVAEGDAVDVEQPLITLESDKATLEVPTTVAGTIVEIKIKEGDSVKQGDVIALLEEGGDAAAPADDEDDDNDNDNADEAPQPVEASEDQPKGDDAQQQSAAPQSEEDIKVPDIGDLDAVEVIEVLVAVGDTVQVEDSLITLESDKATLEVPSPIAGTLTSIKVKEGDKVGHGDVIATVATTGDAPAASEPAQKEEPAPAQQSAASEQSRPSRQDTAAPQRGAPVRAVQAPRGSQLTSVDEAAFAKAHASPAVRKYARELGVDLGRVQGSGRKERILSDDVNTYVKTAVNQLESGGAANGGGGVPTQPDIDYSQFGEIEVVDLPRIRKLSAQAVHKNWLLIPHVTQFDEADITDMEAFRQEQKANAADQGIKLTPLAFLLKASAAALKQFPDLNSSLSADSTQLVHKKYVHIGVAVDTEAGLLMPVVRDVDQKSIFQLAADLGDISSRAREGKLKPDEMKGASFSISSLGGVGGTAFTPIVNSPEVAMLGVSRSKMEPVWNGDEFVPRLILPLSLSYDHRVIDGVKAARITGFLSRALGDLRTLLL